MWQDVSDPAFLAPKPRVLLKMERIDINFTALTALG